MMTIHSRSNGKFALSISMCVVFAAIAFAVLAMHDRWAMAWGVVTGVGAVVVLLCVARVVALRNPERGGLLARLGAGSPDERDKAIVMRSFAAVGWIALLGVAITSIAVAVGTDAQNALTWLNCALLLTLAIGFVVVSRRR